MFVILLPTVISVFVQWTCDWGGQKWLWLGRKELGNKCTPSKDVKKPWCQDEHNGTLHPGFDPYFRV